MVATLGPKLTRPAVTLGTPETSGVPDVKPDSNILCLWIKMRSKLWILVQVNLLTTVLVGYIRGKK
jgi:hypothetical protein